jgi:hypothetical protein
LLACPALSPDAFEQARLMVAELDGTGLTLQVRRDPLMPA